MRKFLKEYFTLTRSEQKGLIVLLCLLVLVMIAPRVYVWLFPQGPLDVQFIPLSEAHSDTATSNMNLEREPTLQPEPFNPNQSKMEDFLAMGLDSGVAGSIVKYRQAGGKFYEKDDLLRIYQMDKETYLALEPFVRLEEKDKRPFEYESSYENVSKVDINKGDSAAFEQLPGIGPVYSSRIMAYREAIGGFDSLGHIMAVYGIEQELFDKVSEHIYWSPPDSTEKDSILEDPAVEEDFVSNLNEVDSAQLTRVKGVGPYFASAIVEYRQKLGGFHSMQQLHEVYNLDTAVVERIKKQYDLDGEVKKINLNLADERTLQNHPYISKALAEFIITYRIDRLKIESLDELRSSYLVDDKLLTKIAPYLEL